MAGGHPPAAIKRNSSIRFGIAAGPPYIARNAAVNTDSQRRLPCRKNVMASLTTAAKARRILLSTAVALSLSLGAAPLPVFAPAVAMARGTPESFADLAETVVDAVVNISASQTIEEKKGGDLPKLQPGTPFDDMFEEFFKKRGQQGEGQRQSRKSNSLGSGFVIDSAGIIITNNHVIADANEITVIFTDGRKLKAELLGKDDKVDVAVLRVKPDKPLKAVKFGDSEKMRVGDWVMAVGNPFGLGGTVTAGIISARNRNIDSGPYDNYIQTDASINKGNSGGPLFNMDGDVVGINTAILSPSGGSIGIGFASPASTVLPTINQLKDFGETRRGWLGVRIQNVDEGIAESLGLGAARGALVAGVDDKGPAKPAGLEAGDVIIKFDGKDIKESRDLPKLVAQTPVDKTVDVTIMRKGQEMVKSVKLGRLEDGIKLAKADEGKGAKKDADKEDAVKKALGMEFTMLNDAQRKAFSIKDGLKGVVVTRVDPDSPAGEKRINAGDVIFEVNQETVNTPSELARKLDAAKSANKKSALLSVSSAQGEVRFVAIPVQ